MLPPSVHLLPPCQLVKEPLVLHEWGTQHPVEAVECDLDRAEGQAKEQPKRQSKGQTKGQSAQKVLASHLKPG